MRLKVVKAMTTYMGIIFQQRPLRLAHLLEKSLRMLSTHETMSPKKSHFERKGLSSKHYFSIFSGDMFLFFGGSIAFIFP